LKGTKRAYSNFEVVPIKVDFPHVITIKRVLKQVGENATFKKFLPDNATNSITKAYLFTLVNTWDPSFFPRLMAEIEASAITKKPEKPQYVEMTPEMLEVLTRM
jgi:hypothetical protein